jgi:hypothetical protein
MAATNGREVKSALAGGAAAGAIAGAVLTAFMFVMALVKGLDPWQTALKGAGAPFLGDAARQPGFDLVPVLVGALCHFAVSIGWGLLFGVLAYGLSKPMTMLAGVAWGIVVWLGMFYVVLPLVGLGDMPRQASLVTAIVYHVVFGVALGAGFLPFQRRKHAVDSTHHHHGHHAAVHG